MSSLGIEIQRTIKLLDQATIFFNDFQCTIASKINDTPIGVSLSQKLL